MALTTTTLSSALSASGNSIVVASATGFAAGSLIRIDDEMMQVNKDYVSGTTVNIRRGLDGTAQVAHPTSTNVTVGLASDFPNALAGNPTGTAYPQFLSKDVKYYSAAGAIDLPTGSNLGVRIINGTGALAMTLANPTKEMDGAILIILGNGKSTSTVTYTAGFGNAGSSYDVATFPAGGQVGILAVACNGFWIALSVMTGTLTSMCPAIA